MRIELWNNNISAWKTRTLGVKSLNMISNFKQLTGVLEILSSCKFKLVERVICGLRIVKESVESKAFEILYLIFFTKCVIFVNRRRRHFSHVLLVGGQHNTKNKMFFAIEIQSYASLKSYNSVRCGWYSNNILALEPGIFFKKESGHLFASRESDLIYQYDPQNVCWEFRS